MARLLVGLPDLRGKIEKYKDRFDMVELRPVDSELMPVEVDVESELIELLADERPVDVEVDSDVTELLVELRPVDNELMPVEVDVDSDNMQAFESPCVVSQPRAELLRLLCEVIGSPAAKPVNSRSRRSSSVLRSVRRR